MHPRTRRHASLEARPCYFTGLPEELQLEIFKVVSDFSDCAALFLAAPVVGRRAVQSGLPGFCDPLFAIAMRLATVRGARISERILRQYAAHDGARTANLPWIQQLSPEIWLAEEMDRDNVKMWRLHTPDGPGASVRAMARGLVLHFQGNVHAERLSRCVTSDGDVTFYDGSPPMPGRKLKTVFADDGVTTYYTGRQGAERKVKTVWPDNMSLFYEGAQGAERKVKVVMADGMTCYYEGERGSEYKVRAWMPNGLMFHYGSAERDEHFVRLEMIEFGISACFDEVLSSAEEPRSTQTCDRTPGPQLSPPPLPPLPVLAH